MDCSKTAANAPRNEKAPPTAPFPIWRMHDGRVFTDFLHRSAYDTPHEGHGSFQRKEALKRNGEQLRKALAVEAANMAQMSRCQAPPVPELKTRVSCDERSCSYVSVSDSPFSFGVTQAHGHP